MDKLVPLTTTGDIPTAHSYKAKLESEGISCFIENEDVVAANPLLTNAVGGILIKVGEKDAQRAKEILSEVK